MSKATNQHYVPQFYLRKFADKQDKVFVFDKFSRKSFATNIRNVASERFFYDLLSSALNIPDGTDPQLAEKALSHTEGEFAKLLDHTLVSIHSRGSLDRKLRRNLHFMG